MSTGDPPPGAAAHGRIRVPGGTDDEALRAALDRSFKLLVEDLIELSGPAFADRNAAWLSERHDVWRSHQPRDLLFWIEELQRHQSLAYERLAASPRMIVGELRRLRGHRNRLYHFEVDYDAASAGEVINTVLSIARRLGLPCQHDLAPIRTRLAEQVAGRTQPVPTAQDALLAAGEALALRRRVEALTEDNERLKQKVELTADQVAALQEEVQQGAADRERAESTIADLRAAGLRLQQEVEIGDAHAGVLAARLDDIQAQPAPALPPEMVTYLTRVLVALTDIAHVWEASRRASGEERAFDLEEAAAAEAVVACQERLRSLVAVVPPRTLTFTPDRRGLELLPTIVGAGKVAFEEGLRGLKTLLALTGLHPEDDESELAPDLVLAFELLEQSVDALGLLLPRLQDEIERLVERLARVEGDPVGTPTREPGSPWPYERGEDVWVLSASSRVLRRPGGRPGQRFADLVGPDCAHRLVRAWLSVRPEGGRVYIDSDGDACTLAPRDDGYVYLGRVPRPTTIG